METRSTREGDGCSGRIGSPHCAILTRGMSKGPACTSTCVCIRAWTPTSPFAPLTPLCVETIHRSHSCIFRGVSRGQPSAQLCTVCPLETPLFFPRSAVPLKLAFSSAQTTPRMLVPLNTIQCCYILAGSWVVVAVKKASSGPRWQNEWTRDTACMVPPAAR
jgi:hypothetical protein